MSEIIISNDDSFQEIKKQIILGGAKNLHIITDFDQTLTRATINGKLVTPKILQLREGKYISKDYAKESKKLYDKYHPIMKTEVPQKEKIETIENWSRENFELLRKCGLNKNIIDKFSGEVKVYFREGILEFFDMLSEKRIPVIILSSSILGTIIPSLLKRLGKNYRNIFVVANIFDFDARGNFIGVKEPIIHSFNKDEAELKKRAELDFIKNRRNVILIGDSLNDLKMSFGVPHENSLNIAFYNPGEKHNIDSFKKYYNVIIGGDGDFSFINNLIRSVK